jgi:hypothetical protein
MFSGVSRGIPSFGDLSWKRPVDFAGDDAAAWLSPAPILSPSSLAPGQTLTKNGNGSINSEPPFLGAGLTVGLRVLVRHDPTGDATATQGIWVVSAVGSASAPWVLTRATDADTQAELPAGTTVATQSYKTGGTIRTGLTLIQQTAFMGTWQVAPVNLDSLSVYFSAAIGGGGMTTALMVTGNANVSGSLFAGQTRGYAEVTADQTNITTLVDLTGLAVTVTVRSGDRIRITGYATMLSTVTNDVMALYIAEGSTVLAQAYASENAGAASRLATIIASVVLTPSAGSHTYKLQALRNNGSGTITMSANANRKAYILVEQIGS